MKADKCSICGKKGLRSFAICLDCLKRTTISSLQIQKLKQINNVLCITADTDGNIKECIQSLTEILEDLERGNYGKEAKKGNTIQEGNKGNIQQVQAKQSGKASRNKARKAAKKRRKETNIKDSSIK